MRLEAGTSTRYKMTPLEAQNQEMPPRYRNGTPRGRGRSVPRQAPTIITLGRHTIALMDADRARIHQANEAREVVESTTTELYEDAMFGEPPTDAVRGSNPPTLLQRLSSPRPEPNLEGANTHHDPFPVVSEPVSHEIRGGGSVTLDPSVIREMVPFTERGAFSLDQSLGHQLAESRSGRTPREEFTCRLYARGGHETMFYDPGERSSLREGPGEGSNHFPLEIVNQAIGPRQWIRPGSDTFHVGQVVWLVQHDSSPRGWSLSTDSDGPFVIVGYHIARYVLVDKNGKIFPVPVHSSQLLPYTSSWSAVRIPEALRNHPEVSRIANLNATAHPDFFRHN